MAIAKEGEQYKYYKNINATSGSISYSLIKWNGNSTSNWWLRSPYYNGSYSFCNVLSNGCCTYNDATVDYVVTPGFAI